MKLTKGRIAKILKKKKQSRKKYKSYVKQNKNIISRKNKNKSKYNWQKTLKHKSKYYGGQEPIISENISLNYSKENPSDLFETTDTSVTTNMSPSDEMDKGVPINPSDVMENDAQSVPSDVMEKNAPSEPSDVMKNDAPSVPSNLMENDAPNMPSNEMNNTDETQLIDITNEFMQNLNDEIQEKINIKHDDKIQEIIKNFIRQLENQKQNKIISNDPYKNIQDVSLKIAENA